MFQAIPLSTIQILPEISLEQFEEINESEFNCIFAESGLDREQGFDYQNEVQKLYYNGQYDQLIRTRRTYQNKNDFEFFHQTKFNNEIDHVVESICNGTTQNMIDFETDEMTSMGYTQKEIDDHIKWKFNS